MCEEEWTLEGEDDLIDLFQANRCLWDTNDKKYRDRDKKAYVRKAMARRLRVTVEEMEKKWKSIRTMYRKAVRVGKSGSAAKNLTQAQQALVRRLQFLAPFTKGAEGIVSSLDDDFQSTDGSAAGSQQNPPAMNNNEGVPPAPANGAAPVANNVNGHADNPGNGEEIVPAESADPVPKQATTQPQNSTTSNSAAEPQPGTSGVTTRSGKVKKVVGKKTIPAKKVPAAAAGSANQVAVDEQPQTPLLLAIADSPRSPTPPTPSPMKVDLTVPSPPRSIVKAVRGKKKDPKVTLSELRQMLSEEEQQLAQAQSGMVMEPFSSLDESPMSATPSSSGSKKKTSAIDEERALTFREIRSTMQAHRKRTSQMQPPSEAKLDDEVGLWASQCERKVRKIEDKLLQEDLMDHVSAVIKRATRGGWSATENIQPRFYQQPQMPYSPALPSFGHPSTYGHSTTNQTAVSHCVPISSSTVSQNQGPTQQQMTPSGQFSSFANWLQTNVSSSPGLPQAPLAVPVSSNMMPFANTSTSKSSNFTNLPGN